MPPQDYETILSNLKGNFRMIEERCSKYIYETDIPLQDIKERERIKEQILHYELQQSEITINNEEKKHAVSTKSNQFNSIVSRKQEMLESVEAYLDYGDYISAKNLLLGYLPYNDLPIDMKLQIIIIEQKYGLINDARNHIDYIFSHNLETVPTDLRIQLNIVNFKILSQEFKFDEIIASSNKLISLLTDSEYDRFLCPVYSRIGFAYAVKYDLKSSIKYLDLSLAVAQKYNEKHAEITSNMFRSLTHLFRWVDDEFFDSAINNIVATQSLYLTSPTNINLWQANRLKSTVQCLFIEAASYLLRRDDRGWIRLVIAHILTQSAKSHPHAEGYSELLAIIPGDDLRNLIELAIYSDDFHRDKFQKEFLSSVSMYLRDCQEVVYQIRNPTAGSWKKLRKLINKLDKKYR
ncbi:MAG: hypothetical protein DRR16_03175 [Candidatus Parabeggiatoa sp. nov. 3]|nr:MAG: hypothetical protein DRR00_01005 [Gammaproteobacteria bacterium]RKZ66819.1 MAG: hypothetical protein DRQ99_08485 [Gammaproteobacteria bacterium]RKZ89167.1 MAG: hypothetical protein DRR16_03175 [Gammaproteobacteria bacterium]